MSFRSIFQVGMTIFLLSLFACDGNKNVGDQGGPVRPSSMFHESHFAFCSQDTTDQFLAGYYGSEPSDTFIYLYIVCHDGDTLYKDHWRGKEMLTESEKGGPDSLFGGLINDKIRSLINREPLLIEDSVEDGSISRRIFEYEVKPGEKRKTWMENDTMRWEIVGMRL